MDAKFAASVRNKKSLGLFRRFAFCGFLRVLGGDIRRRVISSDGPLQALWKEHARTIAEVRSGVGNISQRVFDIAWTLWEVGDIASVAG